MTEQPKVIYLHSTMYLLNPIYLVNPHAGYLHLHSTMYLLNLDQKTVIGSAVVIYIPLCIY